MFLCGKKRIRHRRLRERLEVVEANCKRYRITLNSRMSAILQLRTRFSTRQWLESRRTLLKDLLRVHGASNCADPRDKVYALLAMAYDVQEAWKTGSNVLKPNNSKDMVKLCWDVFHWCGLKSFAEFNTLFKTMGGSSDTSVDTRRLTIDRLLRHALGFDGQGKGGLHIVAKSTAGKSQTSSDSCLFSTELWGKYPVKPTDIARRYLTGESIFGTQHSGLAYYT